MSIVHTIFYVFLAIYLLLVSCCLDIVKCISQNLAMITDLVFYLPCFATPHASHLPCFPTSLIPTPPASHSLVSYLPCFSRLLHLMPFSFNAPCFQTLVSTSPAFSRILIHLPSFPTPPCFSHLLLPLPFVSHASCFLTHHVTYHFIILLSEYSR